MSTYNGWTIVTMPTAPSVKLVEFTTNQIVSTFESPFTGQQQIQDWNAGFMEASLQLPPLTPAQSSSWLTFLVSCKGAACVFQLPSLLTALYPPGVGLVPGGYWRLKNNANKWSVSEAGLLYGLSFDIREAI
jgi:hypothetical protein